MAKKTSSLQARTTMQTLGYDPLEVLIKVSNAPDCPKDVQREIAMDLMPYLYPKLSNVEINAEVDQTNHAPDHVELLRRVLASPELADAAQMLSLEAADLLVKDGRPN